MIGIFQFSFQLEKSCGIPKPETSPISNLWQSKHGHILFESYLDPDKIIKLLDNVSDYAKGDSALHLAAANGHESCVNALLFEYKESPNLWARNGYNWLLFDKSAEIYFRGALHLTTGYSRFSS